VSPEELPDFLRALQAKAATSAHDVVMAMADAYKERVKDNLHRSEHAPFSRTPAPAGGFPSYISGNLSRSIVTIPGIDAGMRATAHVAPFSIYARVQESGAEIFARNRRFLMWRTDYPTAATNFKKSAREGGGLFLNFARHVSIPARPYMSPTTRECVDDGSLTEAAMAAFQARVWDEA
jgi:hypothetical protein